MMKLLKIGLIRYLHNNTLLSFFFTAVPGNSLVTYKNIQFRPLSKWAFFVFVANFLILMQLGAKHVESPFIEFGQINIVLYFLYFTVVMYNVTTVHRFCWALFILIAPYFLAMSIIAYLNMIITTSIIGIFIFVILNDKDSMMVYGNNFYVLIDYLLQEANYTIQGTIITDKYTCMFTFIGICRCIINYLMIVQSVSWNDMSWGNILKNGWTTLKRWLEMIHIIIFFVSLVFFVRWIMNIIGIAIIIDLSSVYTYFVTIFANYNFYWFVLTLFGYLFTDKVDKKVLSLTLLNLILLLSFSCFSFYFFIPYVIPQLYVWGSLVKQSYNFVFSNEETLIEWLNNTIKNGVSSLKSFFVSKPFSKSLVNFVKVWNLNIVSDRSSPFRQFNSKIFTVEKQPVGLTKISKFLPVSYSIPSLPKFTASLKLNCTLANFVDWANSNSLSIFSKLASLSYSKLTFNIICRDYESLEVIYNKNNNYFDFNYIYNNSAKNTNYMSELGLYYPVKNYYISELDFLKYNPSPPKELVNYQVNSLQIKNNFDNMEDKSEYDETIEDIFPSNSVIKMVHLKNPYSLFTFWSSTMNDRIKKDYIDFRNYTDSDKKKLLIGIAKDLYSYFENAYRVFLDNKPLTNCITISQLETDQYKLLPKKLYAIVMLKNCMDENAVFKYDKINFFIYALLLDFYTNGQDPYNFNGKIGYIEEYMDTRTRSLIHWMNVSGIHWMYMKGLNLKSKDNPKYLWHTYPSEKEDISHINPYALIDKPIPQEPFVNYK